MENYSIYKFKKEEISKEKLRAIMAFTKSIPKLKVWTSSPYHDDTDFEYWKVNPLKKIDDERVYIVSEERDYNPETTIVFPGSAQIAFFNAEFGGWGRYTPLTVKILKMTRHQVCHFKDFMYELSKIWEKGVYKHPFKEVEAKDKKGNTWCYPYIEVK